MEVPADPTQAFRLDGRTVVVTGASSGLGARFVRVAAEAGAQVVVAARRRARLDALVDEVRSEGGNALSVECDVTIDSGVDALIAGRLENPGGHDVLVN